LYLLLPVVLAGEVGMRAARFITCVFCVNLLAGCVTTNGDRASVSYAAPSNYRQLVARRVIEGTAHIGPIRSATISQPAEKFAGLVNVGTRPVVCATATNEGRFISQGTTFLFLFENGQIAQATVNPGAIWCLGLQDGPFPEVVKAR
jgi:hypothetical protein